MSERRIITCNLCGAGNLHWKESHDDKFRLADANDVFHDCPKYVKKPRTPTDYPMMKRSGSNEYSGPRKNGSDKLLKEVKSWVNDYKHDMTEDAYADIQDILINHTVMQK